jgi:hypothetical protein
LSNELALKRVKELWCLLRVSGPADGVTVAMRPISAESPSSTNPQRTFVLLQVTPIVRFIATRFPPQASGYSPTAVWCYSVFRSTRLR